ncbi:MAG: hypothetical protein ACOX42_08865 [Clostridia bacterium]|jgi:hypothetical protein
MATEMNEMCKNCHYRITAEKSKPPDLGQMLKLAMMVSNMFGQKGQTNGSKPQALPGTVDREHDRLKPYSPALCPMDALAEDKKIRIIKASLPHLDPTYRQLMHVIAKIMELKNITNPNLYFESSALRASHNPSPLGMLSSIKPHLDPEEQTAISVASKALEMVELFRMMDTITPDTKKEPPSFEKIDRKPLEG